MRTPSCRTSILSRDEHQIRDVRMQSHFSSPASQTFQQHLEIHHPGVGFPAPGCPRDSVVIQRFFALQPFSEPVPGGDVIAGKHIEWLQSAEQDVFGRPSANT
jgi:hypothetical protein